MDENTQKKVNSMVRSHSKNDLLKICKTQNKSANGTKYDLVLRILNLEEKMNKNRETLEKQPSIILRIEKNSYGNYVHKDTGLVFDKNTRKVIGKQLENGNIRPINRSDIEICQKYKFQYNLPNQLDPSPIFEILENSDDEKNKKNDETSDTEDEDNENQFDGSDDDLEEDMD